MKRLYFIRHGESELNVLGKWAGHTNTPLTLNGHEQAKKAGQTAKKQGLIFDLIVSSPLDRAHETAKCIATETNYPHDKIMLDKRLMERYYGELEGKDHFSIMGAKNILDETYIEKYGAEKLADLQKRAEEILTYLDKLPYQQVLVVGHGASGRALWRAVHKHSVHVRDKRYNNAEMERLV